MVAAAFDMPQDGSNANKITRTPTMYPARASVPNAEIIRTCPIQLAMPMKT